ncbi:M15 family metallopeptidase [Fulvivirga sp. M361]|uniref:M15 family metallopeptidase n=1 Tax=Fulvivirga sp. M361 TaxID=2594266 RepID=UPI00117BBFE4|nr:M15 family metallopeptidase [Fulvivirga sp. M361]TRX46407.1 M15 family metallopeptidase [Fulvivirga sp. M361]
MNAHAYTRSVELKDVLHKQLEPDYPVIDNDSPLRSLKDTGFKLIYEPSIMKDYQYLIREEIVEKIERISERLNEQGKTLVIRSAWRSFKHQRLLWEQNLSAIQKKFPNKSINELSEIVSYFIAPYNKSTHTTGGAIDALIMDNKTQRILDFGTNKGLKIELNKKCYPHHPEISKEAKDNRALLMGLFEQEDFVCDLKEYWHFDYGNVGWAIEKGKDHAFYGIIEANQ